METATKANQPKPHQSQRFRMIRAPESDPLLESLSKAPPVETSSSEPRRQSEPESSSSKPQTELRIDEDFSVSSEPEQPENPVTPSEEVNKPASSPRNPTVTMTSAQKVSFRLNDEAKKSLLATENEHSETRSSANWLDEKGLIMKKKQATKDTKPTTPDSPHRSSKAYKLKYDQDTHSLELNINIADKAAKENGCFSQLKYFSFYQALFAELLGTYFLVLYVCGFGMSPAIQAESNPGLNGAIGCGLIVAGMVWCIGHVGGANLNPAVSVALLLTGESNLIRVLLYIPCQLAGSILATLTLYEIANTTPNENVAKLADIKSNASARDLHMVRSDLVESASESMGLEKSPVGPIGLTILSDKLTAVQGFGIETLLTFILVFTIYACIDSQRKDLNGSFPLTIGFTIVLGALFGGKFTGASLNPARTFGPSLIGNHWENHWIYWAGPITGGIIGGFLYKLLVFKTKKFLKHK